jgi:3-oxosteroid 1-dehydrogenase
VSVTGSNPNDSTSKSATHIDVADPSELEWTQTSDFVSVGSGGGSLCAALAARTFGGSALVLEKQAVVGGSTGMSGGILWVPNSRLMKEAGVPDSRDAARLYMDTLIGDYPPGSTSSRKDVYLDEAPRMLEFILGKGVRLSYADGYSDYHDELPGGVSRGRSVSAKMFDLRKLGEYAKWVPNPPRPVLMNTAEIGGVTAGGRSWKSFKIGARVIARTYYNKALRRPIVGNGPALQAQMIKACLDAGVTIWPETPVSALITSKGRVIGVRATKGGQSINIRAQRGVLIGAGGFARNAEMREKYGPQPASVEWTLANAGDTGELIEQAMDLGAAISQMDNAWWIPTSTLPDGRRITLNAERAKPHSIIVDSEGNRFTNEAEDYMSTGQHIYEHNRKVPCVPAWIIIDVRHRKRYPWGLHVPIHTPKEWIASGYMKKADTMAGLARQLDIDPSTLEATVNRFNGFVRKGKDDDFHRGDRAYDRFLGDPGYKNPTLGTLEQAPFYAVAMYPGDVGTSGGLVTDDDGRVITEGGDAFEGLYATGNVTASVMGYTYPGAGASIGASFLWGLLAAEHAFGRRVQV